MSVLVEVDLCRWQSLSSISSSSSSSPLITPSPSSFIRHSSSQNIHRSPSLSFSSPTPFQRRSSSLSVSTQNIRRSSSPISSQFRRSTSPNAQLAENRQSSPPNRRSSSPNRRSSSPNRRSTSPLSKPRVSVTSWTDNSVGDWGSSLPSVKRLAAQYMTSQENLAVSWHCIFF